VTWPRRFARIQSTPDQVMGSHLRRKQGDVDGGVDFMLRAVHSCKSLQQGNCILFFSKRRAFFDGSARTDPLIYRYELACCYCMQLEFKKAAEIFKVLVRAENFQVSEMCAHQLISYRNMCEIFVHSNWLDVAQCWMKCAMIVVGSGDIAALYHT
jgi:hypothetical protein